MDKNNLTFPPIEWMDWNENTLRYLCRHYWYGEASHQPVWEYLVPEARVVKAKSDYHQGADHETVIREL